MITTAKIGIARPAVCHDTVDLIGYVVSFSLPFLTVVFTIFWMKVYLFICYDTFHIIVVFSLCDCLRRLLSPVDCAEAESLMDSSTFSSFSRNLIAYHLFLSSVIDSGRTSFTSAIAASISLRGRLPLEDPALLFSCCFDCFVDQFVKTFALQCGCLNDRAVKTAWKDA